MAICSTCLCSVCGIAILFALGLIGIALGVIDIIVASKWDSCHLDDSPDIYLYVLGGLTLGVVVFGSILAKKKKTNRQNDDNEDEDLFKKLASLCTIGQFGVLIWGMSIFYNSEQGDCDSTFYDYGYYRTLVSFFLIIGLAILAILFASCSCIYFCIRTGTQNDSFA